ncbi:hypothetical protein Q5Y75_24640 [Ruegeria sp. 2205SS24-7]|uniref:hypothetical protein n=1 Tax=Ruegeria discodermiae TaxID=3064389 RepID=UPI0027414AAB|nr:hypothetical protein [Ruegeria sp. 2205SS24-7]MDP5220380.1 hypothetical protein [Ruegeria sp. 2205SS24-7]
MGVSVTLIVRPTESALGRRDWRTSWGQLADLDPSKGLRLMSQRTETAGLTLDRSEDGRLRLVPVIPRGNLLEEEHRKTLRHNLHLGRGTLWLSNPLLRERSAFTLTNPDAKSKRGQIADGCWRRCLPLADVSDVDDFLPSMPAGDPLWCGLDALHLGSMYRFSRFGSDDDCAASEPIEIGEPIDEEEGSTDTAFDDGDGSWAGWANPIVLQFTTASLEEPVHPILARLLQDESACLDIQVTLAGPRSGSSDAALAARFWLHDALRARVLKADYANAPLPRLVFGPNAPPGGALAFLLLDLEGGKFLLDVATGQRARASEWLAPRRQLREDGEAKETIGDWLRARCCEHLGLKQTLDRGDGPQPIPPVRNKDRIGTTSPPANLVCTTGSITTTLAERMATAEMPAVLENLAEALDHPRDPDAPGAALASEGAKLLWEALASRDREAVGHATLIEQIARNLALPHSPILLRFPEPPKTLDETETEKWRTEAESHCVGLVESAHAAGVWWFAGLSEARVAQTPEPDWDLHEVHWAARLYRAAFVQAARNWSPQWKVEVTAGGLGTGLLGTLLLGGSGGPSPAAMLPTRTRITDVSFQAERTLGL